MPRIYVEFAQLQQMGSDCKAVSSRIDGIQSDLKRTIQQLDWDVKYKDNINRTADQIARKLDHYAQTLSSYQKFLEDVYIEYTKLDNWKELGENGVPTISLWRDDYWKERLRPLGPCPCPKPIPSITDVVKKFLDSLKEDSTLSDAKTILGTYGKLFTGAEAEAGILKNTIAYVQEFAKFFTGDKKGLTGARDWCDLATSSVGLWTSGYDYYCDKYKGLTTGFFGDVAQKKVKILGLASDCLELVSSTLSASEGLTEKKIQTIIADYINAGKNIGSVVKSSYELKNLDNVKSLTNIKAGVWSAADVYIALANSGLNVVEQGFRSHEKYFADGQWDIQDTGATGIDISMAGLYGISHSLTLGFDDIIFGIVDSASGGNGTSEMSYVEKAAEGYKILAEQLGNKLGNWIMKLRT